MPATQTGNTQVLFRGLNVTPAMSNEGGGQGRERISMT